MQPQDEFRPYLSEWLEQLRRQARECADAHCQDSASPRSLQEVYEREIRNWLGTLTPTQRERVYTQEEVIRLARLAGRHGQSASRQLAGLAMRQCGMVPKRDWSANGRNRRYWRIEIE